MWDAHDKIVRCGIASWNPFDNLGGQTFTVNEVRSIDKRTEWMGSWDMRTVVRVEAAREGLEAISTDGMSTVSERIAENLA